MESGGGRQRERHLLDCHTPVSIAIPLVEEVDDPKVVLGEQASEAPLQAAHVACHPLLVRVGLVRLLRVLPDNDRNQASSIAH